MACILGIVVLCGAALLASACGADKPKPPVTDHFLGSWCLQSEATTPFGPRVLGGSKWNVRNDGTYSYAFKWHRWDEPWRRDGDTLNLGKLGVHKIVKLDASVLELSQGEAHKYFGRDCGPEYAKAELVHALVEAAANGEPAKVTDALDRAANIDGIDVLGVLEQTALIAAVRAHDVPMVQLLLERGARHDIETSEGITAMNAAEIAGYRDIVELLLKAGARPSTRMPAPRKPTAEELETARVRKLLDLQPGALIEHDTPPPAPAAAALPLPSAAPALPAPEPASRPAPPQAESPKKEEPKSEDKAVDALKKDLCSKRPANLDAPLGADMLEMLKSIGMTPAEYIAQQKAIYDQACK